MTLRPEQRVGRRVGDEQAEAHEAASDTTWFGVSASGRRIHRVAADGISPDQAEKPTFCGLPAGAESEKKNAPTGETGGSEQDSNCWYHHCLSGGVALFHG
jgi:hypothetical protein